MESENSQYPSPCSSSSTPPQTRIESFIGSFITLISNYDLHYEGVLCFINIQDSTLGLQNVICYGTEERTEKGFQIHPFDMFYDYIVFSGTEIKEIIVMPPINYTQCGYNGDYYDYLANSKPFYGDTKPPLPLMVSAYNPNVAKICQRHPSTCNESLIEPQAMTDYSAYSAMGSVYDGLYNASNPFVQPQVPVSYYYDPYAYTSMLNEAHINAASSPNPLFSFFTTFPPPPLSIPQIYGRVDFETKNFKQYELWGTTKKKEEIAKPTYNIDGGFYEISRKPFDPIGRPYNPFGSVARPVKHTEEISNSLQRRLELHPPPNNFTYNTFF